MTKFVDPNELHDLASEVLEEHENSAIQRFEQAMTDLADRVARKLGIVASEAETDIGGLMVSLRPAFPGQEMPEELEHVDPSGEWE